MRAEAGIEPITAVAPCASTLAGVPSAPNVLPGVPDLASAWAGAERVLSAIDFSKRDVVIYVPGTNEYRVNSRFAAAVRHEWPKGDVSLVHLPYEASLQFRTSVSTGVEMLRLVLAGIAHRGGEHRVLVNGWSQGAWVISETLADPAMRRLVERVMIGGHPVFAHTHFHDGHDPAIKEVNHPGDIVTIPPAGDPDQALDGVSALGQGRLPSLDQLGTIVGAAASNLPHIAMLVLSGLRLLLPPLQAVNPEPHAYEGEMARAARFLRSGLDPGSAAPLAA